MFWWVKLAKPTLKTTANSKYNRNINPTAEHACFCFFFKHKLYLKSSSLPKLISY